MPPSVRMLKSLPSFPTLPTLPLGGGAAWPFPSGGLGGGVPEFAKLVLRDIGIAFSEPHPDALGSLSAVRFQLVVTHFARHPLGADLGPARQLMAGARRGSWVAAAGRAPQQAGPGAGRGCYARA